MPTKLPLLLALSLTTPTLADTLSLTLPAPTSPGLPKHMGTNSAPPTAPMGGGTLEWDAASLLHNGKPFIPVMGEIHFSRVPNAEWRTELLKMKAGGITLISTYVFWIHHEEEQGKFTWDGDKDLHKFIQTCADVGLPVIVRIGPWCHGEVRNGGFPDYVQAMPRKRTNDPAYLAAVKNLYDQIGLQLKGLYWKDGGPIVGMQFENEFKGPAAHLVTLKQMALAAAGGGMDVPLYTRTAWDNATNFPSFGDVLPLWGGYAEGFWDRTLNTMPGNYWQTFQFMVDRAPGNAMGADPTTRAARSGGADAPVGMPAPPADVLAYPYLTCELGGGMMSSYHRRIVIDPMDVYSVALAKIGSGSNMPGYYMFHGGTNPDGKLSYLMESQSPPQNMWNDMPVKNYDFGAPLGAAGEIRESYHLARTLHLFLNDWGQDLARMPATIAGTAKNKTDAATLRWAVRADSKTRAGFLFVNNYQRAQDMPAKPNTQFDIHFSTTSNLKIPATGALTIPANHSFIWPINLDLGGSTLSYATAQPLCHITVDNTTYTFFAETPGIQAEFHFTDKTIKFGEITGTPSIREDNPYFTLGGNNSSAIMQSSDGRRQEIFLLTNENVLRFWKGVVAGKQRIIESPNDLIFDGNKLTLSSFTNTFFIKTLPTLLLVPDANTTRTISDVNGGQLTVPIPEDTQNYIRPAALPLAKPLVESLTPAGTLRTIPIGSQKVAAEPTDADFDQAATWKISLPPDATPDRKITLRLHYTGDVARIYAGNKLILDDFYNGQPLDLPLWRLSKDDLTQGLTIKILPLQKNAPIYFTTPPKFDTPSIAQIQKVELLEDHTLTLQAK